MFERLALLLRLTLFALATVVPSCGSTAADQVPGLEALAPPSVSGGVDFDLTVYGSGFREGDVIMLMEQPLVTLFISTGELRAHIPAQRRGRPPVTVTRDTQRSAALALEVRNTAPRIWNPGPQLVAEEQPLRLVLSADDFDGDPVRLFASGLPEGARFRLEQAGSGELTLTPDFIQGGQTFIVTLTASDAEDRTIASFPISIKDTIRPPDPVITKTETFSTFKRLTLSQTTDSYLDSPGYAGRSFTAYVMVPTNISATRRVPVRISLHGFGATAPQAGFSGEVRISPHDPLNTYWWGYAAKLPAGPPGGAVPEYTLRRVLQLLSFVLRSEPGADPERVYVQGSSMGGAGAATLGLLYARHFCWVQASVFQTIPRNHRPSRISQLSGLWGAPPPGLDQTGGDGVWDRSDLTRVLRDVPEAREQFLSLKHGKDDSTIHFGAVIHPSPLTASAFYSVLQAHHIGHYPVWDEGGHGSLDPVLGSHWWDEDWNPLFDDTAFLRLRQAFPAFSGSSLDSDPGDGGNGKQSYSAESGFAGSVDAPGDTGWNGEIAGALNRFLRWDGDGVVDTEERLEIPLRVIDGAGGSPPRAGYPTTGDKLPRKPPIRVDVTPRRVQRFLCAKGEQLAWAFGSQHGVASADSEGAVTVFGLLLTPTWQTLILTRLD